MKTWAVRGIAAVALVTLIVLARNNWVYLRDGYQMRVGFEGGPYTTYDHVFPLWRKLVGCLVYVVLATGVLLGIFVRPSAVLVLGLGMTGTLLLGAYDVWWYGTIRSPTSIWSVVFVVAFFVAAVSAKQVGILR